MIRKINWKNTAENLIISLISFSLGIYISNSITIKTFDTTLDNKTINEKINKPTTEVVNNTDNTTNIKKIKANKDGVVSTMLENKNDSKAKIESIEPVKEDLNPFTSICIDTLKKSRREVINELKKHYK